MCRFPQAPNSGWIFTGWSDGNTQNPRTITVPSGGATYTANFSQQTAVITVQASPSSGGTVSGSGSYTSGSAVTATGTPNSCYSFVNWTQNGAVVSTSAGYSFTASASETLVANFNQINYAITTGASIGGTASGGGSKACGR